MKVELINITPMPEKHIERCARISHDSEENMTATSHEGFIQKIIGWGHLSVLEHASATFKISDVSRVLTHQLVRHRIASITQRSQRACKEENTRFITPPSVRKKVGTEQIFRNITLYCQEVYNTLIDLGVDKEDARYVLPNATATELYMTANLREWRHILELRGSPAALWEIRDMAKLIFDILKEKCPNVFYDFQLEWDNEIEDSIIVKLSPEELEAERML